MLLYNNPPPNKVPIFTGDQLNRPVLTKIQTISLLQQDLRKLMNSSALTTALKNKPLCYGIRRIKRKFRSQVILARLPNWSEINITPKKLMKRGELLSPDTFPTESEVRKLK